MDSRPSAGGTKQEWSFRGDEYVPEDSVILNIGGIIDDVFDEISLFLTSGSGRFVAEI